MPNRFCIHPLWKVSIFSAASWPLLSPAEPSSRAMVAMTPGREGPLPVLGLGVRAHGFPYPGNHRRGEDHSDDIGHGGGP